MTWTWHRHAMNEGVWQPQHSKLIPLRTSSLTLLPLLPASQWDVGKRCWTEINCWGARLRGCPKRLVWYGYNRRKFRSQTSDSMDRWNSRCSDCFWTFKRRSLCHFKYNYNRNYSYSYSYNHNSLHLHLHLHLHLQPTTYNLQPTTTTTTRLQLHYTTPHYTTLD